jgi:hypothetical protein
MFDFLCIQVTVMALALWSLKLVKKTQCRFGWWLQTGQGIEHCSLGVVACETGEENPMQIRVVAANWSKN